MTLVKHKTYGFDFELPEITQGSLEQYEKALNSLTKDMGGIELAVFNGAVVRAAVKVGWLDGHINPDEIDNWKPGKTGYLTKQISAHVVEARKIDPE